MDPHAERRPRREQPSRRPEPLDAWPPAGRRAARRRRPLRAPRRARPRLRPRLPGPQRRLARGRGDLRRGLPARGAGRRRPSASRSTRRCSTPPCTASALAGGEAQASSRLPFCLERRLPARRRAPASCGCGSPRGRERGLPRRSPTPTGAPLATVDVARPARARPRPAAGAGAAQPRACFALEWSEVALRRGRRAPAEVELLALRARGRRRPRRGRPRAQPQRPWRRSRRWLADERGRGSRLAILTEGAVAAAEARVPDPAAAASGAWSARPSPSTPAASP